LCCFGTAAALQSKKKKPHPRPHQTLFGATQTHRRNGPKARTSAALASCSAPVDMAADEEAPLAAVDKTESMLQHTRVQQRRASRRRRIRRFLFKRAARRCVLRWSALARCGGSTA
jgi:hypothetical protein